MRIAASLGPSITLSLSACGVLAGNSAAAAAEQSSGAAPPGYTMTRTGSVHDFEYFAGGWTTHQRRLRARGVGSDEWEDFPATLCMTPYLDGMVTADELIFPTKGWAGFTVRTFDLEKHQWSIYWVSSASGRMESPVVGGFDGNHGEFYGEDHDGDRPVKVRFTWDELDHDHARWQQAFSYDDRTWETNWIADFTRADTAGTCEAGRPKRAAPTGSS